MEVQDLIRKIKVRTIVENPGTSLKFEMEQFFKVKKLKPEDIISINMVTIPSGYSASQEVYITYLSNEYI